ncbi:MAG TPA: tetratricopeptide repeat protein, partial [Pseudonocardiaceae bacterium]|nr:tetratricopeptide repeat protein [Pseudonocardiaceae bacterium]
LLASFGYRTTVLKNPTREALRSQLDQWQQERSTHGHAPVLLVWSGHATVAHRELRLAVYDTSAGFDGDSSYEPKWLAERVLGSGADQILMLIDTCRSGQGTLDAVRVALDEWAKRTFPPGRAGWIGVLASCQADEEAAASGILIDMAGELLRNGPESTYRHAWTVRNRSITGQELIQAMLGELAGGEQRPVHVESGIAKVMFRNPRWQPAQRPQLVEHLVLASRGIAPQEEGWFFTGRRAVLGQIVTWIGSASPGAFVVTGSAGCGKSAVVGRIAALSDSAERAELLAHAPLDPEDPDPGAGTVDAALHLRGMGVQELATTLAERLGLPAPENHWKLISEVCELASPPVLLLDGLDEAIPEQVNTMATELLVPLNRVARVLLATRDRSFALRQPAAGEATFVRLRGLFGEAAQVVDLDTDPGTGDDIERYVASRLRAAGHAELQERVAPALAARAVADRGGFLYARIVTSQVVRQVIDAHADGWERQLTASITEAMDLDVASGPVRQRNGAGLAGAARDLLRALAWALGRGMPGRGVWEAVATALSPESAQYQATDLDWVLEHYGRYIVEDEEDGQAVYRLYHREFVEHLVRSSPPAGDRPAVQAVAEALVALTEDQTGQGTQPDGANPYLRRHLARHASLAGAPGIAALRRLAEANPDAYLPDLAGSLNNLAIRLAEVGQRQAALAPAQQAVEIRRVLAQANPDAYLPNLAGSLNNLAIRLAEVGQRQAALAPAQQATDTYRALAQANPDAYLPDLAMSLNNLADNLAALDRATEALDAYAACVDAFATSPGARDVLIVERAHFQLRHGDAPAGLRALITLLTSDDPELTGSAAVSARRALRAHRAHDSSEVDRTWRTVTEAEPPDWLALTEDQLRLVTDWIATPTWSESEAFLVAHTEELLAHPTAVALDELRLLDPALADQHRQLLELVREHGVESAFLPLVLRDLLITWISAESWAESRSFAEEHAVELLTVEASTVLAQLGEDSVIAVHLALLGLAQCDGIKAAYGCVTDRQLAADRMQQALVEVDPGTITLLALIEGHVFGEQFTATTHLAVAAALTNAAADNTAELEALIEQADVADQQRVAAEIAELIGRSPEHASRLSTLLGVLLRRAPT